MIKDNYVGIKVDERMRKLIEQRAKDEGLSISGYVTNAVLMDSMFSGDVESMQILSEKLKENMYKLVTKAVSNHKKSPSPVL